MNKIVLLVALLSLVAAESVCARTARKVTVALAFSTNENSRGTYSLSIKAGDVYLDGDKLTPAEVARYQPYLTEVMTVLRQAPGDASCAAGHFKHVVIRDGKSIDEKGCLDDSRFAALHLAFEEMRKGRSVAGEQ